MNKLAKFFVIFIFTFFLIFLTTFFYINIFYRTYIFPRPSGLHCVGKRLFFWIDLAREEEYSNNLNHQHRELKVTFWYPANSQKLNCDTLMPYDLQILASAVSLFVKPFIFPKIAYLHAAINAPLKSSCLPYPIIIFSHGLMLQSSYYSSLCQELASHGYVVVCIDHTYDCDTVGFPDGRTIKETVTQRMTGHTILELAQLFDNRVKTWIGDVEFVLKKLTSINADKKSQFYQCLDLDKIGICGHSFGGAVAVQMCRRDARIKCGINMDGGLCGSKISQGFDKPFMIMLAGNNIKRFDSCANDDLVKQRYVIALHKLAQNLGSRASVVTIKNADHFIFTDFILLRDANPLFFLMKLCGQDYGLGNIDGQVAHKIISGHILNFLLHCHA